MLSALFLFTAAIVSNIESVQRTLNIALDQAYMYVFVPVEALIWIRSIAIVLLIVAHALRHAHRTVPTHAAVPTSPPTPLIVTPELLDALRALLAQTTISEEVNRPHALPSPQGKQEANKGEHRVNITQEAAGESDDEPGMNNYERMKAYLATHPQVSDRAISDALTISTSPANKWRKRIESASIVGERHEQYP